MGNTFFDFCSFFSSLVFPFSWQMDQSVFMGIELGQLDGAEIDVPQSVVCLPQTDKFTG